MSEFANKIRLEQIVSSKSSAIRVTTDTSVSETAKILAKKNFRSVPVWDEEEGRFVGFIDEMDLVEYAVVYAHSAEGLHLESGHLREKYSQFTPDEVQKLCFEHGTVGSILTLPGAERRRIHIFQANARLANAMQIIQDYERVLVRVVSQASNSKVKLFVGRLMTRIHRVMDYRILTQTDILRFIFQHSTKGNEVHLPDATVLDSGSLVPVVSITTEERAIDGLLKMIDTKTNACAVVDADGRLVASLSPSDLRGMVNETLKTILLPVLQFYPALTGASAPPPLVCGPGDSLQQTIGRILKASTRRCWMVDDQSRPVGLVSMGKIISFALSNPCEHL